MVSLRDIFEGDVIKGPWPDKRDDVDINKTSSPVKIPIRKVAGGPEYNNLIEYGYHFYRKPSYFEDVMFDDETTFSYFNRGRMEEAIGRKLNAYPAEQLLAKPMPLADANWDVTNGEETFIVVVDSRSLSADELKWMPQKDQFFFVGNRSGANTYIRYWMYLEH